MPYRVKISEHFDKNDYLVFMFNPLYYGYIYHCCDGFLLERVFDKMADPSSIHYGGIDRRQLEFIEDWYEESKLWLGDAEAVQKKIEYIRKVNSLRHMLEKK